MDVVHIPKAEWDEMQRTIKEMQQMVKETHDRIIGSAKEDKGYIPRRKIEIIFGVCRSTVYRLVRDGIFKAKEDGFVSVVSIDEAIIRGDFAKGEKFAKSVYEFRRNYIFGK